jgi:hypothetical protein
MVVGFLNKAGQNTATKRIIACRASSIVEKNNGTGKNLVEV